MYPKNPEEWIALLAVLAPLLTAACTGWRNMKIRSAEDNARQWDRIQSLSAIILNADHAFGATAQIAAAYELSQVNDNQVPAAKAIISANLLHFNNKAPESTLIPALKHADEVLSRRSDIK